MRPAVTRALALVLVVVLAGPAGATKGPRQTTFEDFDGVSCVAIEGLGFLCSDGRTVTTTRASTVPCETAAGTWTHTPAGQACVSVRGLESWGANAVLNTFGADPSNAAWSKGTGVTVAAGPDGGWRVTKTGAGGNANQVVGAVLGADSTRTTACIVKAPAPVPGGFLYTASGQVCNFTGLTNSWALQSCTKLLTTGTQPLSGFNINDADRPLDIAACWHVSASTPGRACWQASGAAPFTCAADGHKISTAGFPLAKGRVRIVVDFGACSSPNCVAFDSRSGASDGVALYRAASGSSKALIRSGGATYSTTGPVMPPGTHVMELVWDGTSGYLYVDGVQVVAPFTAPAPTNHGALATVGANLSGGEWWDGSISRLSWSAK